MKYQEIQEARAKAITALESADRHWSLSDMRYIAFGLDIIGGKPALMWRVGIKPDYPTTRPGAAALRFARDYDGSVQSLTPDELRTLAELKRVAEFWTKGEVADLPASDYTLPKRAEAGEKSAGIDSALGLAMLTDPVGRA